MSKFEQVEKQESRKSDAPALKAEGASEEGLQVLKGEQARISKELAGQLPDIEIFGGELEKRTDKVDTKTAPLKIGDKTGYISGTELDRCMKNLNSFSADEQETIKFLSENRELIGDLVEDGPGITRADLRAYDAESVRQLDERDRARALAKLDAVDDNSRDTELSRRLGIAQAVSHEAYDMDRKVGDGDGVAGASLEELKNLQNNEAAMAKLDDDEKKVLEFYVNNFDELDAATDGIKDGRISGAGGAYYTTDLKQFSDKAADVVKAEHASEYLDKHFDTMDTNDDGRLDYGELQDGFAKVPEKDKLDVVNASLYAVNNWSKGIDAERCENSDAPWAMTTGITKEALAKHAENVADRKNGELVHRMMEDLDGMRARR